MASTRWHNIHYIFISTLISSTKLITGDKQELKPLKATIHVHILHNVVFVHRKKLRRSNFI
jgi:hypothetical protein